MSDSGGKGDKSATPDALLRRASNISRGATWNQTPAAPPQKPSPAPSPPAAPRAPTPAPQPSFTAPQPTFTAPQPSFTAPQPTFTAPQPSFAAPQPKPEPIAKPARAPAATGDIALQPVTLPPVELNGALAKVAMFKDADPAVLAQVSARLGVFSIPAGATVVRAGSKAESVWIVLRGTVSAMTVNVATGESREVEKIPAGGVFGEVGVLLGGGFSNTVKAIDESICASLPGKVLENLVLQVPSIGLQVARSLATKVTKLGILASSGGAPKSELGALELGEGVIPFVTVGEFEPSDAVIRTIPAHVIQQHKVIPLALDGQTLTVGMVSPKDYAALNELRRVMQGFDLKVAAITGDDFAAAVARYKLGAGQQTGRRRDQAISPDKLNFEAVNEESNKNEARVIGEEVVRAVNRMIATALERDASDIHFEAAENGARVRFRVHGNLIDAPDTIPISMHRGIIARLKVLGGLDITERRLPQEGRIALNIDAREIDLRISTMPASRGEKAVLRICEAATMLRPLETTFVDPGLLALARTALSQHSGAVVVAGATGSGKSATLYSMLSERMRTRADSSVVMVEDPIEYRLGGATQIQVNSPVGLTFARVLRGLLRQDPNVIVVGETRDKETAQIALEAAITGHLLMTSLHANSAMTVVQRLHELGCSPQLVAQALSLVLVQRLMPKLCACARVEAPPPVLQESLQREGMMPANGQVPRPVGCKECDQTGYRGRVVMCESLAVKDEVRAALIAELDANEILRIALESQYYRPYPRYAAFLMSKGLIAGADALLAINR